MPANTAVKSLRSICLDAVVDSYCERGAFVSELKGRIPDSVFFELKDCQHRQERTVEVTILNYNNHKVCLGKLEHFPISEYISKILSSISEQPAPYRWNTVYVYDLEWMRQYPGTMRKEAFQEDSLSDYGFQPGDRVTVFVNVERRMFDPKMRSDHQVGYSLRSIEKI